jgi:ferric-dicitrate binding protein FerR (iron transport regulator)
MESSNGKLRMRTLFFAWGMTALSFLFPAKAGARARPSGQEKEALGSLSTAGNVYVNGSLAPAESTIFAGDTVLTGDSATATFSISGKGSLKISAQTHILFAGEPRYLAELTSGTVVMTSFAEATELSIKAGNFVVAPVIQTEQSSSRIEKTTTGSFVIACLDGTVGLLPLEGSAGQVLRSGQTIEISVDGHLGTPQETSTQPPTQTPVKKSSRTGWIVLGAAAAGAAGIAAAVAGRGSHGTSVSPSSM